MCEEKKYVETHTKYINKNTLMAVGIRNWVKYDYNIIKKKYENELKQV
jgi:hypothetical protein